MKQSNIHRSQSFGSILTNLNTPTVNETSVIHFNTYYLSLSIVSPTIVPTCNLLVTLQLRWDLLERKKCSTSTAAMFLKSIVSNLPVQLEDVIQSYHHFFLTQNRAMATPSSQLSEISWYSCTLHFIGCALMVETNRTRWSWILQAINLKVHKHRYRECETTLLSPKQFRSQPDALN